MRREVQADWLGIVLVSHGSGFLSDDEVDQLKAFGTVGSTPWAYNLKVLQRCKTTTKVNYSYFNKSVQCQHLANFIM